jgi:DNA-binding beta-propeller fold protein YncE
MPNCFLRAIVVTSVLLIAGSHPAWAADELFVTNLANSSVTVYARTASGDVAPVRSLIGAATGLSAPEGVAVDTVNNELAVSNTGNNSITVYALTASGNVAPLRTITGASTGLSNPIGMAVDTVNNELLVTNFSGSSITV